MMMRHGRQNLTRWRPPRHAALQHNRMWPCELVTIGQYAQHAGITPQGAYKRIHAGQLGDAVERHGGRLLIHVQKADTAWAERGKPCNSRAAQLEARLMANADSLAADVAGQDDVYCRVAVYKWMAQMLST